jgi:hypothetical protein
MVISRYVYRALEDLPEFGSTESQAIGKDRLYRDSFARGLAGVSPLNQHCHPTFGR